MVVPSSGSEFCFIQWRSDLGWEGNWCSHPLPSPLVQTKKGIGFKILLIENLNTGGKRTRTFPWPQICFVYCAPSCLMEMLQLFRSHRLPGKRGINQDYERRGAAVSGQYIRKWWIIGKTSTAICTLPAKAKFKASWLKVVLAYLIVRLGLCPNTGFVQVPRWHCFPPSDQLSGQLVACNSDIGYFLPALTSLPRVLLDCQAKKLRCWETSSQSQDLATRSATIICAASLKLFEQLLFLLPFCVCGE